MSLLAGAGFLLGTAVSIYLIASGIHRILARRQPAGRKSNDDTQ